MCGIAGVYDTSGRQPEPRVLGRMAALIAHRGPDGEQFFIEGGLGFAHRHLRIIDLSDAAMQPMANRAGTLHLIFNGEIYNYIELRAHLQAEGHTFRTQSDTEVILHAYERWGTDCLHRFNGMFAFALWDSSLQRLFIARDRLGVKPLYYAWSGGVLVFASEIKALLTHPAVARSVNPIALAQYATATYTVGEHTWFKGVKRLLPGHYMLADTDGLRINRWWDLPHEEDEPGARPVGWYVRKTRGLLEDSVRLRLRSDVPLGAHLSGGIDSSAVVALLSKELEKQGQAVRTFSGAFEEGPSYDERPYIRRVQARYGTIHSETVPHPQDLPDLFDRFMWHMDEPTAGPGIILQWAVCELTKQAGVTVINGGQGGDEAWGGYLGYIPPYLQTLARQIKAHPRLLRLVAQTGMRLLSNPDIRSGMITAAKAGRRGRTRPSGALPGWLGYLFDEFDIGYSANEGMIDGSNAGTNALARSLYWDLKWYLPALLHVEDRTSMAFSLESRAPLLDYRLIEHSRRVPAVHKMKGLTTKYMLRRAVRDLLPPEIYSRTDKMGMPTPIAPWFAGELSGWLRGRLLSPSALESGLLDRGEAERALQEHTAGQRDRSLDLWKMLNIVAWWELFIEGEGRKTLAFHVERPAVNLA